MLAPMELPSRFSNIRNRSLNRASLNTHPATSRSAHVSPSGRGKSTCLDRRADAAFLSAVASMEHLLAANQVLNNESQVIPTTQELAKSHHAAEKPNCGKLKDSPEEYQYRIIATAAV